MASHMIQKSLKFLKRERMCGGEFLMSHMHHGSVYTGFYDSLPNNSQIIISTLGEKAPNLLPMQLKWVKWFLMLMYWKLEFKYTFITFHSSYIYHLYISPFEIISIIIAYINVVGEMVIVCSIIITFPYNHLIFQPKNLWEWIKNHICLITISNGQWKSLPIRNH